MQYWTTTSLVLLVSGTLSVLFISVNSEAYDPVLKNQWDPTTPFQPNNGRIFDEDDQKRSRAWLCTSSGDNHEADEKENNGEYDESQPLLLDWSAIADLAFGVYGKGTMTINLGEELQTEACRKFLYLVVDPELTAKQVYDSADACLGDFFQKNIKEHKLVQKNINSAIQLSTFVGESFQNKFVTPTSATQLKQQVKVFPAIHMPFLTSLKDMLVSNEMEFVEQIYAVMFMLSSSLVKGRVIAVYDAIVETFNEIQTKASDNDGETDGETIPTYPEVLRAMAAKLRGESGWINWVSVKVLAVLDSEVANDLKFSAHWFELVAHSLEFLISLGNAEEVAAFRQHAVTLLMDADNSPAGEVFWDLTNLFVSGEFNNASVVVQECFWLGLTMIAKPEEAVEADEDAYQPIFSRVLRDFFRQLMPPVVTDKGSAFSLEAFQEARDLLFVIVGNRTRMFFHTWNAARHWQLFGGLKPPVAVYHTFENLLDARDHEALFIFVSEFSQYALEVTRAFSHPILDWEFQGERVELAWAAASLSRHAEVLGLELATVQADPQCLRRAFREAVKTAHPDKPHGSTEKFAELQNAFEVLWETYGFDITIDDYRQYNERGVHTAIFKDIIRSVDEQLGNMEKHGEADVEGVAKLAQSAIDVFVEYTFQETRYDGLLNHGYLTAADYAEEWLAFESENQLPLLVNLAQVLDAVLEPTRTATDRCQHLYDIVQTAMQTFSGTPSFIVNTFYRLPPYYDLTHLYDPNNHRQQLEGLAARERTFVDEFCNRFDETTAKTSWIDEQLVSNLNWSSRNPVPKWISVIDHAWSDPLPNALWQAIAEFFKIDHLFTKSSRNLAEIMDMVLDGPICVAASLMVRANNAKEHKLFDNVVFLPPRCRADILTALASVPFPGVEQTLLDFGPYLDLSLDGLPSALQAAAELGLAANAEFLVTLIEHNLCTLPNAKVWKQLFLEDPSLYAVCNSDLLTNRAKFRLDNTLCRSEEPVCPKPTCDGVATSWGACLQLPIVVGDLNAETVATHLLVGAKFESHRILFIENGIDGSMLSEVTDTDLQEIGIELGLHRKVLLKRITELLKLTSVES